MRRNLLLVASIVAGCFQEIPFPGEQAEIETDQVNGEDTIGVNEAIFDEFLLDGFDISDPPDGINDIAISALVIIASDLDAEVICEAAANSNTFDQFVNKFDDGRFAGLVTLIVEDLLDVNGAGGFANNDNILGNGTNVFVSSFFFSNNAGVTTVAAINDDQQDVIFIDDINADVLNADFAGLLELDFANNDAGDNINADMQAKFFNAAHCDFDDVIQDSIGL